MLIKEIDLNYNFLLEKAMKDIVKYALKKAKDDADSEDFCFSFIIDTNAKGIKLPKFIKEENPETMVLVIKYQFRNLNIKNTSFSIDLDFYGKIENVTIPFKSILGFRDQINGIELKFNFSNEDFEEYEEYSDLDEEWDDFYDDYYKIEKEDLLKKSIDLKNNLINFADIKNKK